VTTPKSPAISPEQRAQRLAELAAAQAAQREQHVTELADLYGQVTRLRAELKTAEQTYRTTYRRATTSGLLTGPQLRTLGLPPIDARRQPRPTPTAAPDAPQTTPQQSGQ
jgi:hypothetical protein